MKKVKYINENYIEVFFGFLFWLTQFLFLLTDNIFFYLAIIIYVPYTFLVINCFWKIYKIRQRNKKIVSYGKKYDCQIEAIIGLNYIHNTTHTYSRNFFGPSDRITHNYYRNVLKLDLSYKENNMKKYVYSDIIYAYRKRKEKIVCNEFYMLNGDVYPIMYIDSKKHPENIRIFKQMNEIIDGESYLKILRVFEAYLVVIILGVILYFIAINIFNNFIMY